MKKLLTLLLAIGVWFSPLLRPFLIRPVALMQANPGMTALIVWSLACLWFIIAMTRIPRLSRQGYMEHQLVSLLLYQLLIMRWIVVYGATASTPHPSYLITKGYLMGFCICYMAAVTLVDKPWRIIWFWSGVIQAITGAILIALLAPSVTLIPMILMVAVGIMSLVTNYPQRNPPSTAFGDDDDNNRDDEDYPRIRPIAPFRHKQAKKEYELA